MSNLDVTYNYVPGATCTILQLIHWAVMFHTMVGINLRIDIESEPKKCFRIISCTTKIPRLVVQ